MYTSNVVELVTPTKVTTLSHLSTLRDPQGNWVIQGTTSDIEILRDILNDKDKKIEELERKLAKFYE